VNDQVRRMLVPQQHKCTNLEFLVFINSSLLSLLIQYSLEIAAICVVSSQQELHIMQLQAS
jgi:hypothetical protein